MCLNWTLRRMLLWFLLLPLSVDASESTSATKHALLIGINQYQNLPALNGALNDIDAVHAMLISRFGFSPDNIVQIADQDAKRAAILRALDDLAAVVKAGDLVYIHYSGHGSQVEDLDGDEEDGLDETIAPQDARTAGVPDITDDELDRAFARLKSSRLIVTLDSCHSGTGLRSARLAIRQRSIPRDERIELYRRSTTIRTRAVVPLPLSEPYILFTGAADYQSALDGPFANGQYRGLFSFAYTQAMQQLPLGASPVDIMRAVKSNIAALNDQLGGYLPPEPQLEGPKNRLDAPLLDARPQTDSNSQDTFDAETEVRGEVQTQPIDTTPAPRIRGPRKSGLRS